MVVQYRTNLTRFFLPFSELWHHQVPRRPPMQDRMSRDDTAHQNTSARKSHIRKRRSGTSIDRMTMKEGTRSSNEGRRNERRETGKTQAMRRWNLNQVRVWKKMTKEMEYKRVKKGTFKKSRQVGLCWSETHGTSGQNVWNFSFSRDFQKIYSIEKTRKPSKQVSWILKHFAHLHHPHFKSLSKRHSK